MDADERRQQARHAAPARRTRASTNHTRARIDIAAAPACRDGAEAGRAAGTTVRCPASLVEADVGVHAVQRLHGVGRQHVARRPAATTRPSRSSTSSLAQRRGEVQVVRRDDHREAALRVEPAEQRRDLDLVVQVERRRRLVEQQVAACADSRPRARAASRRRGSNCASALAITTRCFSPPLSVAKPRSRQVRGARRLERLARDGHVVAGPRARTAPRCG